MVYKLWGTNTKESGLNNPNHPPHFSYAISIEQIRTMFIQNKHILVTTQVLFQILLLLDTYLS